MFNFSEAARNANVFCPIKAGRTYLKTDEVLDKILTIIEFDVVDNYGQGGIPVIDQKTGEIEKRGIVLFAEYPDRYYKGGASLTRICKAWARQFSTVVDASMALKQSGGVKVKLSRGMTSSGRPVVNVDII